MMGPNAKGLLRRIGMLRRRRPSLSVFQPARSREVVTTGLNPKTQRVLVAASRLGNWLRAHNHEEVARALSRPSQRSRTHHQRRAGGPIRDADGAPAPPFPGLRRWRCARAAQGTLERAARCSPGSIRTAGAASLPPAVANGPPAPFYLCASACSTHPLDVLPTYSPALARQLPDLRSGPGAGPRGGTRPAARSLKARAGRTLAAAPVPSSASTS